MVTVELQLVGLAVIVLLDHVSGVINIFGVLVPHVLQDNSWRVMCLRHFGKIPIQVGIQLLVPLVPDVVLVVSDYAKSPGVSGFIYQRSYGLNELKISVGGDTDEYTPVFGDRVRLFWFVNNLAEVDCEGVVIPLV